MGIKGRNYISLSNGVCHSRTHPCLLLLHFPQRHLQKTLLLRLLLLLQLFLQTTLLVLLLPLLFL